VTPRYPQVQLSVVLPAHNEAANITQSLRRAIASLRSMVGEFEMILIDDASTDDTLALARGLAVEIPELVLVVNEHNLRQGGSLKKGFAITRYGLVTHNALDLPFDFDDLPLLLDPMDTADVVVARRATYPGTSTPRRFVSWVNRLLLRKLFRVPVSDYNFVQLYRKAVLDEQSSFSEATSFITAEHIIRAHCAGRRVVEVEVPYHRRATGTPSSATFSNIARGLRDMFRLRREIARSSRR
jgi:glycosyltransferase involved in cell wall biosynthesis